MKVLPPAPITTCPLSLPGSPQVNGVLNELKMFLWKAMEKKTKTDSGNILLHMYPHFLSLGHHGCFSGIGLLCTLCSMASDCLQYTPLLVTRQCVVSTSQGSICIRIIGSNSFFSPVLVPAGAIWALYLTRISSKCCWQAWPINLWGVQLQLNLLFLLLHLICWMLDRY